MKLINLRLMLRSENFKSNALDKPGINYVKESGTVDDINLSVGLHYF